MSSRSIKLLTTLPLTVIVLGLFAFPTLTLLSNAFLTRIGYGGVGLPFTLSNLAQAVEPFYLGIYLKTFAVAALMTLSTFIIGIGCAFYLAKCVSGKLQACLLFLLVLPFWTSSLARLYSWFFLLGASGPLNQILLALGLIPEPRTFLFNGPAFFLGLLYNNLAYMILPLYGVISKIDNDVILAGYDLYAGEWNIWKRLIIPLSAPGWLAGGVLVFVSTLCDFVTAEILYGSKNIFAANVIQSQFLNTRNWPLGSAMALVFLLIISGALLAAGYIVWKRYPHVFRRDQLLAGFEGSAAA